MLQAIERKTYSKVVGLLMSMKGFLWVTNSSTKTGKRFKNTSKLEALLNADPTHKNFLPPKMEG